MAWYNRLARAVGRAVQRIAGGPQPEPRPPTPPRPVAQSTYEPSYQPVEQPGQIPSAAQPGTPEAAMGLPAERPLPPPDYSEPGPPEWTGYGEEFTIYDPATYDPLPTDRLMTAEDWYREALMPADYLRARYDWADKTIERPNIEILRQLDAEEYFVDWEAWRAEYDAMTSG